MTPRRVPYEIWIEENKDQLDALIQEVFKSINKTSIPKMFNVEHQYDDALHDSLLDFIYQHSSSSLRKS
tara:strand:+ start:5149 stop:5355 length:207 start_codon:yes stop_codon:yes gene_type:complete